MTDIHEISCRECGRKETVRANFVAWALMPPGWFFFCKSISRDVWIEIPPYMIEEGALVFCSSCLPDKALSRTKCPVCARQMAKLEWDLGFISNANSLARPTDQEALYSTVLCPSPECEKARRAECQFLQSTC